MTAPTSPSINNLPALVQSPNNVSIQQAYLERAFQGVYSGTNLTYAAFAKVGSDVNAAVWQIMALTYDGSSNLLSITWPIDSSTGLPSKAYKFVQANYASYTYG